MGLFTRGKPDSFGKFYVGAGAEHSLAGAQDNPLSQQFVPPENITTPAALVRWLVACQVKFLGTSIREEKMMSQGILMAHVKLLLKKYSAEVLVRAVLYAAQVAQHPFSWKFVEEHALPEVLARCPYLQTIAHPLPSTIKKRFGHR